MPSYAKYLKEILNNKRKIDDDGTVALTEECSAIIQNKMPPKLKDPGSFSIPCVIGNHIIDKALCDLGASVSLIPMSICKRLNLGELKPTRMSLQLADRSIKYPVGILEDVPLRIGQLYIPTDFVVMDISEDSHTPIILGRPFLATVGAIIDVKRGKLTFEVGEEKIEFILSKFMKGPAINDTCCFVDIIDECIKKLSSEAPSSKMMVATLKKEVKEDEDEISQLLECLDLTPDPMPEPEQPKIELKELPQSLRYEFLDSELNRPVIVNADLEKEETKKLLAVLRRYPKAIGYTINDLTGISPSVCTHRIMLEEDSKTSREHQRRLNPNMSEVVKKEVMKLLDAGIIYPISDSKWVSPVHVVPKKGGMTVVQNEKGDSVAKRTVTGWRMCIDYRKLNKATRKDHFPLSFIDQMLERLAKHSYFFLPGRLFGILSNPNPPG